MYHTIINYQIIAGGQPEDAAFYGVESDTPDYSPNIVKDKIMQHYQRLYPQKQIAVVFNEITNVDEKTYGFRNPTFLVI
jgi:hypothetical protein